MYKKTLKLTFSIISFIVLISFSGSTIQVSAEWNSTQSWTQQASGCQEVAGNIEGTINNVYLGVGQNVPDSIKAIDQTASAGFLEEWKTQMVGMQLNQFKSFIIPVGKGYSSGELANKDLFFEVKIINIKNDDGTHFTTRNSLVDVIYSLYTNCRESNDSLGGIVTQNNTILFLGLVFIAGIGSFVGYTYLTSRQTNLKTDKILVKSKERESKSIQSLKDALETKSQPLTNQSNDSSSALKKSSSSLRRRR